MKKQWKVALVVAAVAVVGLSVVAVASGAASVPNPFAGRGACAGLSGNAKASAAMSALKEQMRQEMQAWSDKYGADPQSAEAQQALKALVDKQRSEMQALCSKYGVKPPRGSAAGACVGLGAAAGACGGQSGTTQGPSYGGGMMGSGAAGGCGAAGAVGGGQDGSTQGSSYGGGMMGGSSY